MVGSSSWTCVICGQKNLRSVEKSRECSQCRIPLRCKSSSEQEIKEYQRKSLDWKIQTYAEAKQTKELQEQIQSLKVQNQELECWISKSDQAEQKVEIPELAQAVVQLQNSIEKLAQSQQYNFDYLSERLDGLEPKIQAILEDYFVDDKLDLPESVVVLPEVDKPDVEAELANLNIADLKWLEKYNQIFFNSNKDAITKFARAVKASEAMPTEDSLNDFWIARESPILFKEGAGTYWLIQLEGSLNAYLVPNKKKLRLNENNLKSLEICFSLNQLTASDLPVDSFQFDLDHFRVEKPAKMQRVEQSTQWKLTEHGSISFTSKAGEYT